MAGVYNRKLFRQASARDELRKLGGIMASSEELMMEALRTAAQAPRPSGLGSMPLPPQPAMPMQQPMDMGMPMQPMMQQPMDMGMQQPMQPAMPMQQPMDTGLGMPMQQPMMQQQPIQPAIAEPAFMPPQLPQSLQQAPAVPGYFAGGLINLLPTLGAVDIGDPAGTVVEPPAAAAEDEALATAKDLEMRLEEEPPYAVANKILAKAAEEGAELTGDVQADLAGIYERLTGDPAAYEKNIDALNRGIIGAAIGAGTSARATENISKGLLVGLETARDTEERRVRDSRALQLAQLEAQAAASRKASDDNGSRAYRNPVDAYQDAYQSVMNAGEMDLEIPEGMSREEYADQVAMDLIRRSYSPDQLVGSPFEGMSAPTPAPAATGEGGYSAKQLQLIEIAKKRLAEGTTTREKVEEVLSLEGIPPEVLDE
jgi:hypothetical protein